MVCGPADSGAVCTLARPELSTGAVPTVVAPSVNVTMPVGPPFGLTVAVRVTAWPAVDGFWEDDRLDVVGVARAETQSASARQTLRRPPVRTLPDSAWSASTPSLMASLTAVADMGLWDSTRAAAPATMGAAAEVPSKHHSPVPSAVRVQTLLPGAARSTLVAP